MDYGEIANLSNLTFDQDVTPNQSSRYIAHEIIFMIFCIIGTLADIAIIYTIFRFHRLRTIPNIFLANWAIADLCFLFVTPSGYRILSIIDNFPLSEEFICVLLELGLVLHSNVVLFVILVSIDWCLAAHFRRASEKFRINYKTIIGTLWIVTLISCSINTGYCLNSQFSELPLFILLPSFCATLLIVISLQISRGVQNYRKKPVDYPSQMLTLATFFVICYILGFIIIMIHVHVSRHPVIVILSYCLIFSNATINFTFLYCYNKDFQSCFLQAIRRSGGRYEESISDFNVPITDETDTSLNVSFHNPTEELLTNAY